jgi:hypothetical protein
VDYRDFPELTVLEGLMFQRSPKERNFKPEYADEQWQDVNVLPGNKNSEYLTCFSNKKLGKLCFLTNPVYAKKHLKNAEKNFEVLIAIYGAKKVTIQDKNKIISAQIATRIIKLNEKKIVALNIWSANQSVKVENQITRNFQIEKFGIWNSDYPRKQPAEAVVQGNFMNGKSGGEIKLRTIFLVLKSENQVISIPARQAKRGVRFKPSEEYMLWGVAADGKMQLFFSVPQFKSILKSTENYRFNMKLIDSKVFAKYTTENIFEL